MSTNLTTKRAAVLGRYRQLRATMRSLHNELLRSLPPATLKECAEKLGLMVRGKLVFDTEDEMGVLMDYCLHHGWTGGQNTITRFLSQRPYPEGSDEILLLDAMSRARFSLFQVESVAEGLGANGRDLLRGDGGSIIDEGLGNTAVPGIVFAGHLVTLPELSMTTGAALQVDADTLQRLRDPIVEELASAERSGYDHLSHEQEADRAAMITRTALGRGASSRITMVDAGQPQETGRSGPKPARRPSRNDPCPCGSGKKYKRCCGGSA